MEGIEDRVLMDILSRAVGPEKARVAFEALSQDPSVSIRLNPYKLLSDQKGLDIVTKVPWSEYGVMLPERPRFVLDPLFHAGCYYVQDSSAMFVGTLFRKVLPERSGLRVLDLCAAPGGKTTDLAASLRDRFGDGFSLLANEVMRKRYPVLRTNVRTWGDPRVGTVCLDPSAFRGEAVLDLIVADVPCSGEGMFRKDEKAVRDWSLQTVSFCAARTRRILSDIWDALAPGGLLLYSTCTFNHLENDDTVAWAAASLGADILDEGDIAPAVRTRHGYALLPGLVPGEGQYAAVLRKHGEPGGALQGDPLALFHAERPAEGADPGYPRHEVDRSTALKYLHGDALSTPDAPLGLLTLTYEGLPLGPAKNIGTRCNNLYPKESRIRMDIR